MRHLGWDCQVAGCPQSPQAVKCLIPTWVTALAEYRHQNILPWWGQGQRCLCLTGGFNGEGLMKSQSSDSETAVRGSCCAWGCARGWMEAGVNSAWRNQSSPSMPCPIGIFVWFILVSPPWMCCKSNCVPHPPSLPLPSPPPPQAGGPEGGVVPQDNGSRRRRRQTAGKFCPNMFLWKRQGKCRRCDAWMAHFAAKGKIKSKIS